MAIPPINFSLWQAVYQQRRRWLDAGVFEEIADQLRIIARIMQGRDDEPTAAVLDARTLRSSCESGSRAGYDGHKKKHGSKVHIAVDTLGNLLDVIVTPAEEQGGGPRSALVGRADSLPQH